MARKPYYITTAIAYTSKTPPHIGNTYEAVLTDAIARYKRLEGFDVFFFLQEQMSTDKRFNFKQKKKASPPQKNMWIRLLEK